VLFTIISPIIGKVTNLNLADIDYEKYFEETETYQAVSDALVTSNNQSVQDIYIDNLKQDMKNKLKEKGYRVNDVDIQVDVISESNYGKIEEIRLVLEKSAEENKTSIERKESSITIDKVEKVVIGNKIETKVENDDVEEIKSTERNELKQYLSGIYDVNKNHIKINE